LALKYVRKRPVPEWKRRQVKEIRSLLTKYPTIAIADINYVTAPVLHEIRAKLRERGDILRVVKNRLVEKALRESGLPNANKLIQYLKGSNALIFTTFNPFELKLFLDKNKIAREAKAGDIAQNDIIIPAGNTNLPPGPVLSIFSKLRVETRIKEGSIWVEKDTVVARKGDVISGELAELLKKLDIKPIEVGLQVKAAYVDGLTIAGEDLEIDLESMKSEIAEAVKNALNLAVNAAIPVREAIPLTLTKAQTEALNLALNTVIPLKESIEYNVSKAVLVATNIYEKIKDKL